MKFWCEVLRRREWKREGERQRLSPAPSPTQRQVPIPHRSVARGTSYKLGALLFQDLVTEGDTELREGTDCQPIGGALNPLRRGEAPTRPVPMGGADTACGQWMWGVWWTWPSSRVIREVSRPGGLTDSKQRSYIKVEARAMKSELFLANKFPPGFAI